MIAIDMKMPKNCFDCPFTHIDGNHSAVCPILKLRGIYSYQHEDLSKRDERCPLMYIGAEGDNDG